MNQSEEIKSAEATDNDTLLIKKVDGYFQFEISKPALPAKISCGGMVELVKTLCGLYNYSINDLKEDLDEQD